MRLSYSYDIDGRKLFVFDGTLTTQERDAMGTVLEKALFFRQSGASLRTKKWEYFGSDFSRGAIAGRSFVTRASDLVAKYFPGQHPPRLEFTRVNLNLFGDIYVPRRDSPVTGRAVTGLYYTNARWDWMWAGETTFFNDKLDAVAAVSPKPGRLVLFDGSTYHRVGSVARACSRIGYSVALKFGVSPRQDARGRADLATPTVRSGVSRAPGPKKRK
jgi:SM-20-related protein